jgi:hypothetical protein
MDNVDVNLLHQCSVLVTSKASGIITRSTMVDANAACMATNPASRPGSQISDQVLACGELMRIVAIVAGDGL